MDRENRLFQFKFTDNEENSSGQRRRKRSLKDIASILDQLGQDNRVEYVVAQRFLNREKRELNLDFVSKKKLKKILDELDEPSNELRRDELDAIDNLVDEIYEGLVESKEVETKTKQRDKRRKSGDDVFDELIRNEIEKNQVMGAFDVPKEIAFNDERYSQQWYLINEGQLKSPLNHDLNVRQAWLNGYTGKNVTIVILDDGLDYEHPDFQGKYVC